MVVRYSDVHADQAALLQGQQKLAPGRLALAVGELHPEHLALPLPVDANRQQHRLALDHAVLTHLLIARVQDQIRIRLGEPPLGKLGQPFVEPLLIVLIVEAAKLWPHSSSVIAFTLRVDTPCTYISTSADTSAFSLRWK